MPDSITIVDNRTVGWLAQWQEMLADPEQNIVYPRQVNVGAELRDYIPLTSLWPSDFSVPSVFVFHRSFITKTGHVDVFELEI